MAVDAPARSDFIGTETVERLRPAIEAARVSMAAERRLPGQLARRLGAEGALHLLGPVANGGLEMTPRLTTEFVEALSSVDGSTGWASMIGSQWSWFTAFFEPGVFARSVDGTPAILAGALKPGGEANPVDGGFRVWGRWPLASGATYANYLAGTCVVANSSGAGEQPDVRLVVVPADEATVLDTWQSAGLRGTGSTDFALNDVFVPGACTLPYPQLRDPLVDGPLYRDRYYNLIFASQAGQALGVARAAFDSFREIAASRIRWGSTAVLNESAVVRTMAAEAYSRVAALRAWAYGTIDSVWATIAAGSSPTAQQRLTLRLAITEAITGSLSATELLFRAAGAGGLPESAPLHRQYQDLLAAGAHVQATPVILEHAGAALLGGKAPPPVLF